MSFFRSLPGGKAPGLPYDAWEEKSEQYEEAVGDYEALLRNLQAR